MTGFGGFWDYFAGRVYVVNSKMSDTKAVIKSADMSEEMQQEAIECSTQALEKFNIEKDIASHIKREFDKKYGKQKLVAGRKKGWKETLPSKKSCVIQSIEKEEN